MDSSGATPDQRNDRPLRGHNLGTQTLIKPVVVALRWSLLAMLSVDVMGSVMSLCLTLSFAPRGTPMFIADRINFLRDDQEVDTVCPYIRPYIRSVLTPKSENTDVKNEPKVVWCEDFPDILF